MLRKIKIISAILASSLAIGITGIPCMASEELMCGADVSSVPAYEKAGTKYGYENGQKEDALTILHNYGVNYFRVRIWNNPYDAQGNGYGGGNCDLQNAINIGNRAAKLGVPLFIDFQYSDFWADPSLQNAPLQWKNYTTSQKAKAIYDFTYKSLDSIIKTGATVGMVQIGNETNGSMSGMGGLFDGVWDLSTGVAEGMKSGCNAVDAINKKYSLTGDKAVLKALHFTDPITNADWYAEQAKKQGVNYDVVALSAYPFWFGHVSDLKKAMKKIVNNYDKKVVIAETAYPYTFDNHDDSGNNIWSVNDIAAADYDISVAGQEEAMLDIYKTMSDLNQNSETRGYGLGAFYWGPEMIGTTKENSKKFGTGWANQYAKSYSASYSGENECSSWDNNTLFDNNGNALSSIKAFRAMRKYGWSWKFSDAAFSKIGKLSTDKTINDLTIKANSAKPVIYVPSYIKYNWEDYDGYLALSGGGSISQRSVSVYVPSGAKVTLILAGDKGSRTLICSDNNGNTISKRKINSTSPETVSITNTGKGQNLYFYSERNGINLYKIETSF